jgi:hypothetical protein
LGNLSVFVLAPMLCANSMCLCTYYRPLAGPGGSSSSSSSSIYREPRSEANAVVRSGVWCCLRCFIGVKFGHRVPQCVLYPLSHIGLLPGVFMASRPESCNSNRTALCRGAAVHVTRVMMVLLGCWYGRCTGMTDPCAATQL